MIKCAIPNMEPNQINPKIHIADALNHWKGYYLPGNNTISFSFRNG